MDPLVRKWLTGALLLIPGAAIFLSHYNGTPPEIRYKELLTQLRNGEFAATASAAHQAQSHGLPEDWRFRFLLLEAEATLEAGNTAHFLQLLSTSDSGSPIEYQIRSRVLKARQILASGKNYANAGALLAQASDTAQRFTRADLEPEILSITAQKFAREQQFAESAALFQQARDIAAAQHDFVREATAVNGLAMLRMLSSRCDEAIPLFELAHAMFEKQGAMFGLRSVDNNLAICYGRLGDFEKALSYRQTLTKLIPPSLLQASNVGEMGSLYLDAQQPQKALPHYREALQVARKYGNSSDAARWAGNLTLALAAVSKWEDAEKALAEALELGPEPRSIVFLNLAEAEIAIGRRNYSAARELCERVIDSNPQNTNAIWQAYADIGKAWTAEGNPEQAGQAFEKAIGVIEASQSLLSGAEYKMTFLARLIQFYQDYVDLLIAHGEPVKALKVADSSRARLLAEAFSKSMDRPRVEPAADFQQTVRASGRTWLSYWLGPRQGYLWVVTAARIRVIRIPGSDAITPLVEQYRGFIEGAMRDPMTDQSEAGRRLYEALVAPAAEGLPKNAKVMIVPDGPLHQLSFDTLPVYGTRKPHYWLADVDAAIAPSFGLFRSPHSVRGRPRPALLFGDALSPDAAYPRLRFAAQELAVVSKQLSARGTKSVTGKDVRPEVWRELKPYDYSIIHIAAHAEANRARPLESALILSPGKGYRLLARDLIAVPVSADLVTISACRSSGARVYAGEGLVGLTWAFLHAGARSVIAGLWDVSDESTALLMDELYSGIKKGDAPATALRDARLALLSSPYAKPYYWGPFQCYVR